MYFTAELISRECPRAFIDNICVYVPHCMDCRFPYDLVDMGDLVACNYPTLAAIRLTVCRASPGWARASRLKGSRISLTRTARTTA